MGLLGSTTPTRSRSFQRMLGLVARGDVVHVEQHLVAALAVPDLAAGVAGVRQDGRGPRTSPRRRRRGPVAVARRVVGAGGGDAVAGQALGDGADARAREVLGEDPSDDGSGGGSGSSWWSALAVRRLAGFGCGPASASR